MKQEIYQKSRKNNSEKKRVSDRNVFHYSAKTAEATVT